MTSYNKTERYLSPNLHYGLYTYWFWIFDYFITEHFMQLLTFLPRTNKIYAIIPFLRSWPTIQIFNSSTSPNVHIDFKPHFRKYFIISNVSLTFTSSFQCEPYNTERVKFPQWAGYTPANSYYFFVSDIQSTIPIPSVK